MESIETIAVINEVVEYERKGYINSYEIVEAYAGKQIFRRYTLQDCISYSEAKSGKSKDSKFDITGGSRNFREGSLERSSVNVEVASKDDASVIVKRSDDKIFSISDIETAYEQGEISADKKTAAQSDGVKYDIINMDNGKSFVKASRKIITATTVSEMRNQITDFFKNILKNGPITINTAEGDVLTITDDPAKPRGYCQSQGVSVFRHPELRRDGRPAAAL